MGILSGVSDFFGLDVGTTAVRVVQLSGKHPNKTVFRYGKLPVDPNLVGKTDVDSLAKLADIIRETLVQNQITTRNVVMGLPTEKVYSVVKDFEVLAGSDLKKSLAFEVPSLVPDAGENSKIDWAILDEDIPNEPKKDVFVCSINKDFIQQRLELLESINLNVLAFEPDPLALIRAMASSSSDASIILDVGFRSTDIVATARNQPRLIISTQVGVFNMIKLVMNNLQVDQEKAKELIFTVGLQGDQSHQGLTSLIIQSMETIVASARKAISFFTTRHTQYNLSQIVLWGDVVYIPGLAEFLTQQLDNLPVVAGDSWQNVFCPPQIQNELQLASASFAVAAGLAERQVI